MENIIFVIITYKEIYWETKAFKTLYKSYIESNLPDLALEVLIIDNTDVEGWTIGKLPFFERSKVHYMHFPENIGISRAYNFANKKAIELNIGWHVFLDQDTSLPENFFLTYLKSIQSERHLVKIPRIFIREYLFSPSAYHFERTKQLNVPDLNNTLVLKNRTFINSGLAVNSSFFKKIGGYNQELKLDMTDHDFVFRLRRAGIIEVEIMDVDLQQDFSAQTNTYAKDQHRYRTYVLDLKAYSRDKNRFLIFFALDLPHCLKLCYKHRTLSFLIQRFFNG